MPKTKRDLLRRQAAHAHRNVELAQVHLFQLEEAFHDAHPELAEAMRVSIIGLTEIQKLIDKFWVESWGPLPTNWEAVRNVDEEAVPYNAPPS